MAHRFDRRKLTEEEEIRKANAEKGRNWHAQINKDMMKNGLSPESYANKAIEKAYEHSIIHTKTRDAAHNIRMAGNGAKHEFK